MSGTLDDARLLGEQMMETLPPPPGNGQVSLQSAPETLPPPPTQPAPPPAPIEHTIRVEAVAPKQARARAKSTTKVQEDTELGAPPLPRTAAAQLNKIMPNAVKFSFWKRDEVGNVAYINRYEADALRGVDYSLEAFIQKYLLPAHGEGSYVVKAHNAKGDVAREHELNVLNPQKAMPIVPQQSNGMPAEFFDRMWQRMERLEEKATQHQTHQPDPLTMLQRYKEALGGSNDMMPFIMMMMQQQQKNPLQEELRTMKEELKRAAQPSAPPMPLPAPSEGIGPKEILQILQAQKGPGINEWMGLATTLLPALKEIFGGNREHQNEIQRLRDEMNNQRMEMLISELREIKNKPARGIQETLAETQAMFQFAQSIAGSAEPNFWSVAEAAVQNIPETAQGLGALMDKVRESEAERGAQRAEALRQAQETAQGANAPEKPQAKPEFPEGFHEAVERIAEAKDPAERIGALIQSLQVLAQGAQYRAVVMKMFKHARAGEEEDLKRMVEGYLSELTQLDMLTPESAADALACVEEYAAEVMEHLGGGQRKPTAPIAPEEAPTGDEASEDEGEAEGQAP